MQFEDQLHGGTGQQNGDDGAHAHRTAQGPAGEEGAAFHAQTDHTHGDLGDPAGDGHHETVAGAVAQTGGHINIHAVAAGDECQNSEDKADAEILGHGQTAPIGQQGKAGKHIAGAEVHDVAAQGNVDKGAEAQALLAHQIDDEDQQADGDVGTAKGDQVSAVGQLDVEHALEELCGTVVEHVPGAQTQIGHQTHSGAKTHDGKTQNQGAELLENFFHNKNLLLEKQFLPLIILAQPVFSVNKKSSRVFRRNEKFLLTFSP